MIKFLPNSPASTQQVYRFVHISDPHLSNLNDVRWRQLLNKRILGYLSWRFNRRHIHRLDILDALIRDLDGVKAQHLIISGDLTHIGTPDECRQISTWLDKLGSPANISVVPGNHDAYIQADKSQTTELWSSYMSSDLQTGPAAFPSLRRRGPLAIIGLSTALPTAPFFATGRLGKSQIEHLARLLEQTREQGLLRIVVLHHGPLADSNKFRKRLVDSEQFRSVIEKHGAELILHGHGHHPVNAMLDTASARVPVIGVTSASLLSHSEAKRAGYNIFAVIATAKAWKIQLESRIYDENSAAFTVRQELEFILPRLSR